MPTVADYYNTNHESGEVLAASIAQARQQEAKVLTLFQQLPDASFSRAAVGALALPGVPYTSVQRCLTNLTKKGKLKKLDHMVIGDYGKQVHTWTLAPQNN